MSNIPTVANSPATMPQVQTGGPNDPDGVIADPSVSAGSGKDGEAKVIPDVQTAGLTINGGSVSPSDPYSPPDASATESRLEAVLARMSDESLSMEERMSAFNSLVNDPDMLAELMIKFSTMGRQQALDARLAARAEARAQLEGQAGETRDAADKMKTGAWVSFALAAASALVSIGSAASAVKSLNSVKSLNKQTFDLDFQANAPMTNSAAKQGTAALSKNTGRQADAALQAMQIQTAGAQGLAKLSDAGGQAGAGHLQANAKKDEADGQMMAAAAQDSQAQADFAKQQMDDMKEMMKTAMEFIKELNRLETELMANFTRLG